MSHILTILALTLAVTACGESRRHDGKGQGQNADAKGQSGAVHPKIDDGSDSANGGSSGSDDGDANDPSDDLTHTDPKPTPPVPREVCQLDNVTPELATIDDLVEVINALPMPVTLPCLLDVLPRPLRLVATSSGLSIQPALDPKNPRIFALTGQLVLAVLTDGPNASLLEFSQILSSTTSIKGEIVFPVTALLDAEAPYAHTARLNGSAGTRCAACHANETLNSEGHYESRALRPSTSSVLPYLQTYDLMQSCSVVRSSRCDILKALFGEKAGDAMEGQFPADMPTMF